MPKFIKEFRDFAVKGNMIDLAVGVIIGGAFGKIITSLVNDLIMPLLSVFTGKIDFKNLFFALDGNTYLTLSAAKEAGAATINYGLFITVLLDFLIVALCIFFIIKLLSKLKRKTSEPVPKAARKCPYCFGEVHDEATRCPHCTSQLGGANVVEKL